MIKIIPILLLAILITPAYAHTLIDSNGSQTSLQTAININDPQVSQVFYETLRMDNRHYYSFDAAKGETIHFELLIPILDGLQNYYPTIAFYKLTEIQCITTPCNPIVENLELIRYSPPMFFDEIPAQRSIFYESFSQSDWYKNQAETRIIDETGTYVIEIFDEGDCIVINGGNREKNCQSEFFSVIQGKYGLVIGTIDQNTIYDNIHGWIQTRIFFEDPIGNFISGFERGGVIETGGSPEDIGFDDTRWIVIGILLIITTVLIWKREYLRRKV